MRSPSRGSRERGRPAKSPPMLPLTSYLAAAAYRWLSAILIIAAVGFPLAVLYLVAAATLAPDTLLPTSWSARRTAASAAITALSLIDLTADFGQLENEDVRLERVLEEAAMTDKTVLLTILNCAWASPGSVVDLFLESFRIGNGTRELLNHLVLVTLDNKAYMQCMSVHPHCFALVTPGMDFSGVNNFMTVGYLSMMWRRIDFLRAVLEKGYNFIFSDVDIMWFRNPIPHFYPDGDFQIACDHFYGDPTDIENMPNGGFNYVKSNNRSIQFYKFWYASREKYPGYHDQDVLNRIKYNQFIEKIGIKFRFLSTEYFGGICEPSKDFSKVCTMHANCCIGLNRKLHDLGVILEDWRTYMSLPWNTKINGHYTWSVPQNCRNGAFLGNICFKHINPYRIFSVNKLPLKQLTEFADWTILEAKLVSKETATTTV